MLNVDMRTSRTIENQFVKEKMQLEEEASLTTSFSPNLQEKFLLWYKLSPSLSTPQLLNNQN